MALSGTVFGSTASYVCDAGFTLVGVASRSCQATGLWSGVAPVCDCKYSVASKCMSLLSGFHTEKKSWRREVNRQHIVISSHTLFRVLLYISSPIASGCGALKPPDGGDVVFSAGQTVGSLATYSCGAGFTLEGVTRPASASPQGSGLEEGSQPAAVSGVCMPLVDAVVWHCCTVICVWIGHPKRSRMEQFSAS